MSYYNFTVKGVAVSFRGSWMINPFPFLHLTFNSLLIYLLKEKKVMLKKYLIAAFIAVLSFPVLSQTVEEVTVTATRQAESLQDIALSVQAITGEDLMEQHIETASDLANSTTGVSFSNAIGSGIGLKIRGLIVPAIGSASVSSTDVQINGHSASESAWTELGFLDAERLEILEGPQGTLYGKNTSTGLMNLISARPGAGNYLKTTVGEDGYTMVKAAADFDVTANIQGRIAISKFDKDPTVTNLGTGNKVDNRDSYGARLSLDWAIDDNNQLNFNYEQTAANDSRLNLGTSSCNRQNFFGCSPDTANPEDNINRPVFISGTISNTFDFLTLITTGTDTLASSDVNVNKSIDVINKTRDAKRQQTNEFAQLEWTTGMTVAPGDLEIKVKASNQDTAYYQLDDNDHNNATGTAGKIGSALLPRGTMTIASLPGQCFNDTSVQFAESNECSRVQTETNQFEVNVISDFDNHNFAVGAYVNKSDAINEYTIQTTAYQLLTDFKLHPLASLLFDGSLDTMGGQTGYGVMAATVAAQAANIANAIAADGNTFGTNTKALGRGLGAAVLANAACGASSINCVKDLPIQVGGLVTDQRTGLSSKAIFGEYYFTFMDNFKLTLGARYMDDRFTTRSLQGLSDTAYLNTATSNSGLTEATSATCRSANYEACWQEAHKISSEKNYADTYKGVLQYSYDQGMAYVSMTTGNRAGGANPDASSYAGSKSTSYELGSKNILMDGRLKLNANIFRHEQDDAHYSVTRFSSTYVEPHDIVHQGLQLDTEFFITENLVIDANVLMTDSEFTKSTTGIGYGVGGAIVSRGSTSIDPHNPDQATSWTGALTAAELIAFLQTAPGGGLSSSVATQTQAAIKGACDASGLAAGCSTASYQVTSKGNIMMNPLGSATIFSSATAGVYKEIGGNKVPGVSDTEATFGLSTLYDGAGGTGAVRLGYSFKDSFEGDIYNNKRFTTGAQEYIDLNATYEPNQGDWYLNLWAKNLADKRQLTSVNRTSNLQGQVIFLTYSEGMRAGLDFGINF